MKLIVAVARDWGIGCDGCLLFNLPKDMEFFKNTTMNHVVVMGRQTLMSFPGSKPLKNRTNIVLTRNEEFYRDDIIICHSTDELFEELKKYNSDDVFVIGGGCVYDQLFPYCDEAYITKIDAVISNTDTYLHNFDEDKDWDLTFASEVHENNGLKFTFNTYKNKNVIKI